jgi:excisionase family DNA binding protein
LFREREKGFEPSTPALARSFGAWDPVARQWSTAPHGPSSQGTGGPYPDGGEPLSIGGHGIGGAQTGAQISARLRALEPWPNRLLTVADVAEALSVSKATVYALVERGELAHVRISNAIRVAPSDFEAFIGGQRKP